MAPNMAAVTGDITMDWGIKPTEDRSPMGFDPTAEAALFWQAGGAVLLGELMDAVKPEGWSVSAVQAPEPAPGPCDRRFHHSFALWHPYPGGRDGGAAWRVERFLGVQRWAPEDGQDWSRILPDTAAELTVLIDANLDFRKRSELWPQAVCADGDDSWVVLRLTYADNPLTGDLWKCLQGSEHRLLVITSARDLRRSGVKISREISWERSAEDVVRELQRNPAVTDLSRRADIVVSFGTAGTLLAPSDAPARLLFDPDTVEGEWSAIYPGRVLGTSSCLTAALAYQIMLEPDRPDLAAGVERGVRAMRELQQFGYSACPPPHAADGRREPRFPKQHLNATITAPDDAIGEPLLSIAEFDREEPGSRDHSHRSILEDNYRDQLEDIAKTIVRCGVERALGKDAPETTGVPIARFGDLVTVDRSEIEALRSIRSLIAEYCKRPDKPFSIGVFGPPGAGKSFAVEEVAKSALAGEHKTEELTFNLSQFADPGELLDALHQVRDERLSGKMPLVTWDEFDTTLDGTPLGWLRYFLAPMQDGKFHQGQITHPIGPCVFLFTGSTGASRSGFEDAIKDEKKRVESKVTDFLSRLNGYIDVLGPNPRMDDIEQDPFFVVRRAIILRSLLWRAAPQIRADDGEIRIDDRVLRALLHTRTFRYGVRSMGAVITSSRLSGLRRFQVSSLPQGDQLLLHVTPDFLDLVG